MSETHSRPTRTNPLSQRCMPPAPPKTCPPPPHPHRPRAPPTTPTVHPPTAAGRRNSTKFVSHTDDRNLIVPAMCDQDNVLHESILQRCGSDLQRCGSQMT